MCSFFDYRRMNNIFISGLLSSLFCGSRRCATEIADLVPWFYICIFVKMTTKTNSFDVLNVSFYWVYVVITFTCSNWAVCQNAYKFTKNAWTHIRWAKAWLTKKPIGGFYWAMFKLVNAWHAIKLDRRNWSIRHDVFYYSEGVWGNKRDCYFYKPEGLFA